MLNAAPPGEDESQEPRPAWHWVGFGAVIILAAWLPLAYLAELIKGRFIAAYIGSVDGQEQAAQAIAALSSVDRARLGAAMVGFPALALAVGALAGGFVVGRWGGQGTGWREAAAGGGAVGVLTALLALTSGASASFTVLVPIALMLATAGLGGLLGARARKKAAA